MRAAVAWPLSQAREVGSGAGLVTGEGLGAGAGTASLSSAGPTTETGREPARGGNGSSTVSIVSVVVVFRVVRRMKGEAKGTGGVFSGTARLQLGAQPRASSPGVCARWATGPLATGLWLCWKQRVSVNRREPSLDAKTLRTVAACSSPVENSSFWCFLRRTSGVARQGRALSPEMTRGALDAANPCKVCLATPVPLTPRTADHIFYLPGSGPGLSTKGVCWTARTLHPGSPVPQIQSVRRHVRTHVSQVRARNSAPAAALGCQTPGAECAHNQGGARGAFNRLRFLMLRLAF